jgi:hypothetical protein
MKNIHCIAFGHDYKVTRNVTNHVKEYTCKTCKKQLTTNGSGNLVPLTPKFRDINDVLERIHHRRIMLLSKRKSIKKNNFSIPA